MQLETAGQKLIRAYVPKDQAQVLAQKLVDTFGEQRFSFSHARGETMHSHVERLSYEEKDILQLIVHADQADEIFSALYHWLQLDEQPGSMLIQQKLNQTSLYQSFGDPSE